MSWGGPEFDKGEVKIDPTKSGKDGSDQAWKKTADTHKMSPESVKAAGVEASQRPPGHGHGPGEVLHQRGRLPFSYPVMTLAGIAVIGVIGYGVLYSKKKDEVGAMDVARVATNTASPEHTEHRPRK